MQRARVGSLNGEITAHMPRSAANKEMKKKPYAQSYHAVTWQVSFYVKKAVIKVGHWHPQKVYSHFPTCFNPSHSTDP